jgi:hypothetical protein
MGDISMCKLIYYNGKHAHRGEFDFVTSLPEIDKRLRRYEFKLVPEAAFHRLKAALQA